MEREKSFLSFRMRKHGPLELTESTNQIRGFWIPDRWDAWEKNNYFYFLEVNLIWSIVRKSWVFWLDLIGALFAICTVSTETVYILLRKQAISKYSSMVRVSYEIETSAL